jgi:hypothetical protein
MSGWTGRGGRASGRRAKGERKETLALYSSSCPKRCATWTFKASGNHSRPHPIECAPISFPAPVMAGQCRGTVQPGVQLPNCVSVFLLLFVKHWHDSPPTQSKIRGEHFYLKTKSCVYCFLRGPPCKTQTGVDFFFGETERSTQSSQCSVRHMGETPHCPQGPPSGNEKWMARGGKLGLRGAHENTKMHSQR